MALSRNRNTFTPAAAMARGRLPQADFTSDGITDFIVWYSPAPYNRNYFAILKGNGDGTFQRETTVKLPDNMEELQIVSGGDFNSDGLLDFIMIPLGGIQDYLQK